MTAKGKSKAKQDTEKIVQALTSKLLKLMGIESEFSVVKGEDNETTVVNIEEGEQAGLLIGHHGETLNSFQAVLGMMLRQKQGDWSRITVNVGDWRLKQEEHLRILAEQAAERAISTGEPQALYNLAPAQRRIIHMVLSEKDGVKTESFGEGINRYLIVKSKTSKKSKG